MPSEKEPVSPQERRRIATAAHWKVVHMPPEWVIVDGNDQIVEFYDSEAQAKADLKSAVVAAKAAAREVEHRRLPD